jgi:hypothetical protein
MNLFKLQFKRMLDMKEGRDYFVIKVTKCKQSIILSSIQNTNSYYQKQQIQIMIQVISQWVTFWKL